MHSQAEPGSAIKSTGNFLVDFLGIMKSSLRGKGNLALAAVFIIFFLIYISIALYREQ